ncbi:MAG: lipoate protein ligase C-terminal domain-containing protein, partial [Psychrobacter sp.]|nr:lipoate protein ligase C-terminal domain-containing protein [Psychrobacter sp.]
NLTEFNESINHEVLSDAIIEAFCEYYDQKVADVTVEELDEATLAQEPHLNKFYQQMADWDWRFGKTPEFSHHLETRFDWGLIDLHLDVKQAVIEEAVIFSDALNVELIDALKEALTGVKYNKEAISAKLSALSEARPEMASQVADFSGWLVGAIKG